MKEFSLKTINNTDLEKELESIGFDDYYKKIAKNKKYRN